MPGSHALVLVTCLWAVLASTGFSSVERTFLFPDETGVIIYGIRRTEMCLPQMTQADVALLRKFEPSIAHPCVSSVLIKYMVVMMMDIFRQEIYVTTS